MGNTQVSAPMHLTCLYHLISTRKVGIWVVIEYKTLGEIRDVSGNRARVVDFIARHTSHQPDEVDQIVGEFLSEVGPTPCLTVARHLATADCEAHLLARVGRAADLPSLYLTYPGDRYLKDNPEKRRFLERHIFEGTGRAGGPKLKKVRLKTRPAEPHDVRLLDIRVENAEQTVRNLLEFHLDERAVHGLSDRHVDVGRVLAALSRGTGGSGRDYNYPIYFALTALGVYVLEDFECQHAYLKGMQAAVARAWRTTREAGLEPCFIHVPDTQALAWYPASPEIALPETVLELERQLLAA